MKNNHPPHTANEKPNQVDVNEMRIPLSGATASWKQDGQKPSTAWNYPGIDTATTSPGVHLDEIGITAADELQVSKEFTTLHESIFHTIHSWISPCRGLRLALLDIIE